MRQYLTARNTLLIIAGLTMIVVPIMIHYYTGNITAICFFAGWGIGKTIQPHLKKKRSN